MNKLLPSACIDKSLFHEISKISDSLERTDLWEQLYSRCRLVIPSILIEETVKNALCPGEKPADEVERLVEELSLHSGCWMEDIDEIVFCELVEGHWSNPPPPITDAMRNEIFSLRGNDNALREWLERREIESGEIHAMRKRLQKELAHACTAKGIMTQVQNEKEFFQGILSPLFHDRVYDAQKRHEMLEQFLGLSFRGRHPEDTTAINSAFSRFAPATFAQFYCTSARLLCHLAYVLGPIFTLRGPSPHIEPRFLKQDRNNLYDSDYVSSAIFCDWFLTRDEQQARIARVFADSGFWKGKVKYLPSSLDIRTAVKQALA